MKNILILLIHPFCLKAHYIAKQFKRNPDALEWVGLMNVNIPNVLAVDDVYKKYYSSHPFKKNKYTQYYERR